MSKPLVVITGASHGIGLTVARKFAADGHPLLLIARRRSQRHPRRPGWNESAQERHDHQCQLDRGSRRGRTARSTHASKAAVRSLGASLQKGEAGSNIRVINVAPGFVKTNIHAEMGISFAEYRERLGNPEFISAQELAGIIFFCWKQPQRICVRDIVVMPTTSSFS